MTKTCKVIKCSQPVDPEYSESGLCKEHWLHTEQEFLPGVEMTGADWLNFCESE